MSYCFHLFTKATAISPVARRQAADLMLPRQRQAFAPAHAIKTCTHVVMNIHEQQSTAEATNPKSSWYRLVYANLPSTLNMTSILHVQIVSNSALGKKHHVPTRCFCPCRSPVRTKFGTTHVKEAPFGVSSSEDCFNNSNYIGLDFQGLQCLQSLPKSIYKWAFVATPSRSNRRLPCSAPTDSSAPTEIGRFTSSRPPEVLQHVGHYHPQIVGLNGLNGSYAAAPIGVRDAQRWQGGALC